MLPGSNLLKSKDTRDSIGILILRLFAFSMIAIHGWEKLIQVLNGGFEFLDPLGIGEAPTLFIAVLSEFVSPIFVLIGYKTRPFTIPTILTLLVVILIFHAGDPFIDRELAFVYLVAFSSLLFLGGGKISLDYVYSKKG